MTWLKIGEEFPLEMANADLSDAAFRTHIEGLSYAMDRENNGRFGKREVKRFAETQNHVAAVQELLDAGFWTADDDVLQIVHHINEQPTAEYLIDQRRNTATRKRREREKKALLAQDYTEAEIERILDERGLGAKGKSSSTTSSKSPSESHRDRTRDPERNGAELNGAELNGTTSLDVEPISEEEKDKLWSQDDPAACSTNGCIGRLTDSLIRKGEHICNDCIRKREGKAA